MCRVLQPYGAHHGGYHRSAEHQREDYQPGETPFGGGVFVLQGIPSIDFRIYRHTANVMTPATNGTERALLTSHRH